MTKRILFCNLLMLLILPLLSFNPSAIHTVSGKVTYKQPAAMSPSPLSGVTVQVIGTGLGTMTDINGDYYLTVPNGSVKLRFSYTGLDTQEVDVDNRSTVNVQMTETIEAR